MSNEHTQEVLNQTVADLSKHQHLFIKSTGICVVRVFFTYTQKWMN